MAAMSDVKAFRKVDTSAETAMEGFLAMASELAAGEIGCDMTAATGRVERASGDGTELLFLSRWPITGVTSVQIEEMDLALEVIEDDDAEAYQDVYLPAHGYWLEMRRPAQTSYGLKVWPVGVANVKVTYDHGLATLPADLRGAVAQLTWLLWQERDVLGSSTLTVGDRNSSIARDLEQYPAIAKALRRYRRPRIG